MRFLASFILLYWFQNSLKNWPTDSNRKKSVCWKKNCFLFEFVKNIVKKKNPHRFNLEKKFMMRIDRYMNQIYPNLPL